jgi:hypothetical protein
MARERRVYSAVLASADSQLRFLLHQPDGGSIGSFA